MAKKDTCGNICCTTTPAALERIQTDISSWEAGAYAIRVAYGPACVCGATRKKVPCARHPKGEP